MFRYTDALFYLSSASAQVWSALMVFHILLVRDLKHQVEHEIDTLWADAKLWWPKLMTSMKTGGALKQNLKEFGLSSDIILRADTHKDSFIRLVAAIKTHKIISEHLPKLGPWEHEDLTPEEWQLKFEPIVERIQELETERPDTKGAFSIGVAGVSLNLVACALTGFAGSTLNSYLLATLLLVNILLLYFFSARVRKALDHFDVTAKHEGITEQIDKLEKIEARRVRLWNRRSKHRTR